MACACVVRTRESLVSRRFGNNTASNHDNRTVTMAPGSHMTVDGQQRGLVPLSERGCCQQWQAANAGQHREPTADVARRAAQAQGSILAQAQLTHSLVAGACTKGCYFRGVVGSIPSSVGVRRTHAISVAKAAFQATRPNLLAPRAAHLLGAHPHRERRSSTVPPTRRYHTYASRAVLTSMRVLGQPVGGQISSHKEGK